MKYTICIFEDQYASNLSPLSLTRPVFDLRCGISSLKEKILRHFPGRPVDLCCRNYLKDLVQQENPDVPINKLEADSCLFINGRVVAGSNLSELLDESREMIYLKDGQIVMAFLKGSNAGKFRVFLTGESQLEEFVTVERRQIDSVDMINYPWDLVHHNLSQIEQDFRFTEREGNIEGSVSEHAILIHKPSIYIGKNAMVKPGAVIDAETGPVFIGEGVKIMPNAVIEGPAFIGDGSIIQIGAKIYEGTSIGEVCKVGGEVGESIIHSYSNKQHDGYLGHAYLGQWVNLGANTNNSDLKNNYGNVKVMVNGEMVDSGSMLVGLTVGDHSKSGINTMFNTGTVVGVMCSIFGAGFPAKYLPSFVWGGVDGLVPYDFDKAVATAKQVMIRRKKDLTPEYLSVLRAVFETTENERN